MNVPVIHLSTDYVFDGTADRLTGKMTRSARSEPGASKLLGEEAVAAEAEYAILRTRWVYSPFGKNFVKTMLRLAGEREELGVVADQYGSPTSALDIADGIIAVGRNLLERPDDRSLRGLFHMTGTGFTSWSDFAAEIFPSRRSSAAPPRRFVPSRQSTTRRRRSARPIPGSTARS